ncbi:unnamed protein product [Pleuronectes platessa]|uniref:Uncharacterized protein n=1 Tax=Pleuronectes platessa TaxID=8262 RepID=A0A9N7UZS6_PLEPL|nr:unnamed protein product [Pleuronectes platessa]
MKFYIPAIGEPFLPSEVIQLPVKWRVTRPRTLMMRPSLSSLQHQITLLNVQAENLRLPLLSSGGSAVPL